MMMLMLMKYNFFLQLLDKRIEIFINSSETLCNNNSEIKPFVINSVTELRKYWNDFKDQVNNTRHSIEDTKSYFNLNDQVSDLYILIAFNVR